MTLESQTPRVVITGNGTRGPYSLVDAQSQPIRFMSTSHVRLVRYSSTTDEEGTTLVENTDYTIGGTQDARTFTLAASEDVLATTERIVADRNQSYAQDLGLSNGAAFGAVALMNRLDKYGEYLQELKTKVDRKIEASALDSTPSTFPLKANALEGDLLGFDASKNLVPLTPADIGISSLLLGSGWSTVLGLPAAGILDNISGVRFVANYAGLTALTTATGLSDDSLYFVRCRSTDEDGGDGVFRYDSASTATANGGTILAIDGGGAGRFFRLFEGPANIRWFGCVGDGATDCTTYLQAAVDAEQQLYAPNGSYLTDPITIDTPVSIEGENTNSTIFVRKSSQANDYDGIFNVRDGGSYFALVSMSLVSKAAQTGGCLVSIKPTSSGTLGIFYFEDVDFTTLDPSGVVGTHAYTVWMDGTAKTSAPIGIRGVEFHACNVFGASTSVMLVKGVLKFSFIGGGVYPAGGNAASNINITGTAGVPSSSFLFAPADCSCDIALDYCSDGTLICGVFGAITNTANTADIHGHGRANSCQNNWTNSTFLNRQNNVGPETWATDAFAIDTTNKRIGINTASPSIAGDFANGYVSGYWKTSSTTKIGTVGYQHPTTVPDTQTITFTTSSGGAFRISTGGGAGALFFADYKSATISILSDPSSEFENSNTPTAGKTGVYKSANSHVISIKNGTGASQSYAILFNGIVNATTDPA